MITNPNTLSTQFLWGWHLLGDDHTLTKNLERLKPISRYYYDCLMAPKCPFCLSALEGMWVNEGNNYSRHVGSRSLLHYNVDELTDATALEERKARNDCRRFISDYVAKDRLFPVNC